MPSSFVCFLRTIIFKMEKYTIRLRKFLRLSGIVKENMAGWLVGCFTSNRLVDWLVGRLVVWLADLLSEWFVCCQN